MAHLSPAGWGGCGGLRTRPLLRVFWVGNRANRMDTWQTFAQDMAVILDYWGREPGEMVTRVKGHEGEKMDVFPLVNSPRLRKQGGL